MRKNWKDYMRMPDDREAVLARCESCWYFFWPDEVLENIKEDKVNCKTCAPDDFMMDKTHCEQCGYKYVTIEMHNSDKFGFSLCKNCCDMSSLCCCIICNDLDDPCDCDSCKKNGNLKNVLSNN